MLGYFEDQEKPTAAESQPWVLILHYDFKKWRDRIRKGNEKDVENITSTFSGRGCKVRDLASLKKEKVLKMLGDPKELESLFESRTAPTVFILFILSHGLENGFIQTDHELSPGEFEMFNTSEIWTNTKRNSVLEETLKIFFLGPCRGKEIEKFVSSSADPDSSTTDKPCSTYLAQANCKNLICLYSTVETTMAGRDLDSGTYLVQAVCKELREMREDLPLEIFLTKIQNSIRVLISRSTNGDWQTPEIRFFPFRKYFIKRPDEIVGPSSNDAGVKKPLGPIRPSFFQWKREGDDYFYQRKALFFSDSSHEQVCKLKDKLIKLDFIATIHPLNDAVLSITEKVCTITEEDGCLLICVFGELSLLQPDANNHQEVCVKIGNEIDPIRRIIGQFTGEKCPQLVAKPKVFFFLDMGTRFDTPGTTIIQKNLYSTNHSSSIICIAQGKDAVKGLVNHFVEHMKKGGNLLQVLNDAIRKIDVDGRQQNEERILPQVNSTLHKLLDFPCNEKTSIEHTFKENYEKISFSDVKKRVSDALSSPSKDHKDDKDFKTTVVSSAAGTGKSITTDQLSKHLKSNVDDFLIVHVALSNHKDFFSKNLCQSVSTEQCLEYILKENKPELTAFRRLFPRKRVMLLLDGFDEICPIYRFTALSLIKDAADMNLPMWITTRPQEEKEITKVLKDVKFNRLEIDELSTDNKIKVLQQRLNWPVTKCETLLKDLESNQCSELSSNILHLSMICDNILSGAKVISLFQIYDSVFQEKLRKSLLREGVVLNDKSFEKNLERKILHYKAAVFTYLGKNHSKIFSQKEITEINNTGLLTITGTSANYVHKTFYEFLLCRIFLDQHGNIITVVGLKLTAEDLMKLENLSYVRKYFDDYFGHKYCAKDLQSIEDILKELEEVSIKTVLESICKEGLLGIYDTYFNGPNSNDMLKHEKDLVAENPHFLFAACCSNEKLALKMIARGAEVKSLNDELSNPTKRTTLMYKIAENDAVELLKILLAQCTQNFKDFQYFGTYGKPAVNTEAFNNNRNLASIIEKIAYVQQQFQELCIGDISSLHVTAQVGSKVCVEFLLKECESQKVRLGVPPILFASFAGHSEVVQTLIENGEDINTKPIIFNEKIALILFDILHHSITYLRSLLPENKLFMFLYVNEITQILLQGRNALHVAAAKGHADVAQILVENGIEVNAKDENGCTPLALTFDNDNMACFDYLVNVSEIDVINEKDQTVLHIAAKKGDLNLILKCVEHGVKIEAIDYLGNTAFHYAAMEGHLACVEYFVQKFPQNLDCASFYGNTALNYAVGKGQLEVADFLKDKGIIVSNENDFGHPAASDTIWLNNITRRHMLKLKKQVLLCTFVFTFLNSLMCFNDKLLINSYTSNLKYTFLLIDIIIVTLYLWKLWTTSSKMKLQLLNKVSDGRVSFWITCYAMMYTIFDLSLIVWFIYKYVFILANACSGTLFLLDYLIGLYILLDVCDLDDLSGFSAIRSFRYHKTYLFILYFGSYVTSCATNYFFYVLGYVIESYLPSFNPIFTDNSFQDHMLSFCATSTGVETCPDVTVF